IPSKPRRGSARCTAWPWGSRISGLSMTSTTTRATGTPGGVVREVLSEYPVGKSTRVDMGRVTTRGAVHPLIPDHVYVSADEMLGLAPAETIGSPCEATRP